MVNEREVMVTFGRNLQLLMAARDISYRELARAFANPTFPLVYAVLHHFGQKYGRRMAEVFPLKIKQKYDLRLGLECA